MTGDDIEKAALGTALAGALAAVIGLVKTVFDVRELGKDVESVQKEVKELREGQMTKEDMRELIDRALDKREESSEKARKDREDRDERRRAERSQAYEDKVRRIVGQEIKDAIPHIRREVRGGDSSSFRPKDGGPR